MKTCLEYMGLNIYKFLISQNISADLQGPKEKYKKERKKNKNRAQSNEHISFASLQYPPHAKITFVLLGVHVNHFINYFQKYRLMFENHTNLLIMVILGKMYIFSLQIVIHKRAIC